MNTKRFLPPSYFMSSVFLIAILHFIFPILQFIYFPWNLTGLILLAAGGILNLLADKDLKHFNTTVKPFETSSALITNGVYHLSRNPMYLGMSFLLLGESVLFGSLSPFIITIIFMFLIYSVFIRKEEKMLLETFKNDFISYKKKVRCWI